MPHMTVEMPRWQFVVVILAATSIGLLFGAIITIAVAS
jgi:hypothetical protein